MGIYTHGSIWGGLTSAWSSTPQLGQSTHPMTDAAGEGIAYELNRHCYKGCLRLRCEKPFTLNLSTSQSGTTVTMLSSEMGTPTPAPCSLCRLVGVSNVCLCVVLLWILSVGDYCLHCLSCFCFFLLCFVSHYKSSFRRQNGLLDLMFEKNATEWEHPMHKPPRRCF